MPILKYQLTDILIDEVDSFVINFQGSLGMDEMKDYRIAINLLQVYKEENKQ
jgi:hypothetical protein